MYIPLENLPTSPAGMVDEKAFESGYVSGSASASVSGNESSSSTSGEGKLQGSWASVHGKPPGHISAQESFLRLGGDSITAMELVAAARREGLFLTVGSILTQPRLSEVAELMGYIETRDSEDQEIIEPFSLLTHGTDMEEVRKQAAEQCKVDPAIIEDVFPCTMAQKEMLAPTTRRPQDNMLRIVTQLRPEVDTNRLRRAWMEVSANTAPVLRTRIIDLPGNGLVQVVLNDPIPWDTSNSTGTSDHIVDVKMTLGTPLTRLGVINADGNRYFTWTQHHALSDHWLRCLIEEAVTRSLLGQQPEPMIPFQPFVNYLGRSNEHHGFWREQFANFEMPHFPSLPIGNHRPHSDKSFEHTATGIEWPQDNTANIMVRSAWAILLSWYGDSPDTVFGVVVTGRGAPTSGIERLGGRTTATVPLRVNVEGDMTLQTLQQRMLHQAIEMIPFEQVGLQNIRLVSEEADRGCQFQSLLVMHPDIDSDEASDRSPMFEEGMMSQLGLHDHDPRGVDVSDIDMIGLDLFNTYAITLHCQVKESSLLLKMAFDSTMLSEQAALRIMHHFDHILHQISITDRAASTKVSDLDIMTTEDLRQVWKWNAKVPEETAGCFQDLITDSVRRHPHKSAICAWDGELTYSQMNDLSTRLAHHLVRMGVRPGALLPLCFEKSMWMPVTQFAVMKAGAASVVIDPSQTKERLKTIIETVGSGLILCGPSTASLISPLTEARILVVQRETISKFAYSNEDGRFAALLPLVKPSDLLYAVFTSGSTGIPKCAMITHSNFTSAVQLQQSSMQFKATARVADFSSYAFDVAWSNVLHTLAAGACLCIPSEHERKHDFVKFLIKNKVTYVNLTPSVAAILELNTVPTLDTVVLIGEAVDFDKLPYLKDIKTTIITYGPCECTVTTTAVINNGKAIKNSIGWAAGSTTWVVNPNKDALMPIGLIGELLLEGPLVGKGYLNNAEKTTEAFIKDPSWLLRGSPTVNGRRGRLYRTGDLVRYDADGELIFCGRKDTQVKIRGHRTELGDIEHHVRRLSLSMSEIVDVIAEVVTPKVIQSKILVVFLQISGANAENLTQKAAPIIETLEREMVKEVPAHMIPSLYIPMTELPMTLTGKTDRKALREIGARIDLKVLASLYGTDTTRHIEPTTEAEIQLRNLWASILNLPVNNIGTQDNFLRLGGDSIAAIRLVTAVGKIGMVLTIPDIFSQPQLSEMANLISQTEAGQEFVEPFSLLNAKIDKDEACRQVAESCSISVSAPPVKPYQIEDIFPCTALQEGLLAMTARSADSYVGYQIAELKPDIDLVKFQEAWRKVSQRASVLRTRIVDLSGQGLVQVVLREPLHWQTFSSLDEYEHRKKAEQDLLEDNGVETGMGLGTPLSRFGIIYAEAGKRYFVWTQHHAIYDGWSLPLMKEELEKAFRDEEPNLSSFPLQSFVKHVMNQRSEKGTAFWQQQFAEIEASQFPAMPSKSYQPNADKIINHTIESISWPSSGVTASSALRTAWATLLSWYVDSPDVVFGAVVSGRQAPVLGIEDMAGPTIATVPLRILVHGTVDELLHQVQRQAVEMVQFEQYGLQHIRQISSDAELACDFQTLLLIHPSIEDSTSESLIFENGLTEQANGSGTSNTYAMMLTCQISGSTLHMQLSFDSAVVEAESATRMLHQLEHILGQLCSDSGSTEMISLVRANRQDLVDIWEWNKTVPETVKDCVHDVFSRRVTEKPETTAVCAWDGELTYHELDQVSTLLAGQLASSELGIGPGDIIPLYFEKSMWVPVAILAVMKAGAASVALDATLPTHRLKGLVSQLSAKVILTSKSCTKLAAQITDCPSVEVSDMLGKAQLYQSVPELPEVCPSSALYIVFTSGSTGVPKGATITHANFCSAIQHQQRQLGFERSSRVFDYTSYSFDVAWSNILHTLTVGGCLCIPSEDDRTADAVGAIHRLQANFLHLTPTVGRFLDPVSLKGVEKILFIGEALKMSDVARWEAYNIDIYNTYGPAECTIVSTIEKMNPGQMGKLESKLSDPSIGMGVGAVAWVVQPRTPDKLAAIGTIGELWLEGPIVGAGYLNNVAKTADAFVDDPEWLLLGVPGVVSGRRGRLYRTGDLVHYNPDGSLAFIGRKDTQVKINGQRMELGEVEHHIRQLIPADVVSQIIADVITPDATQIQILAVFLSMSDDNGSEKLNKNTALLIGNLRKELSRLLPSYMVPSAYIPVVKLPMTSTGKTDRRMVRELGKTYSPPEILSSTTLTSDVVALTITEEKLRDIWARLLNIKPDLITAAHYFLEIGGNSIKTMSLAMAIRKQFNITIGIPRLIGQHNNLHELANLIDNLLQGQFIKEPELMDLDREIDVLVSKIQIGRPVTKSTVFLTGSTGFLGTQILRYTLTKGAFDRVVLLVRGLREQKGLERVREAAKIAGWWKESFIPAIEVWDGDLSAERLGLTKSQWCALCGLPSADGTVDAIIHNGAVVHWTTNYDTLKAVNVDSTTQLLQAAIASPFVKSFVYVSGGLITDNRTWTKEEAQEANGYDQTKYVSEKLVSAAAARFCMSDTKFSVVKPGQIIGDVYTGVANTDDFLWRVVMSATRLGARPIESETSWLSVSDVRHISEIVLWHATGNSNKHFNHITRGMWVSTFWAAVEDQLQLPLRPVSWAEWIEMAREDMAREQELHPLWPVQQFLGNLGTEMKNHDRCEFEIQEVVAAARQNIEYLRKMEFMSPTGRYAQSMNGKVPTRTRNIHAVGV